MPESTDTQISIQNALIERDRYRAALLAIQKGEGRFSRDHKQHCINTVEDMITLATTALENPDA